MDIMDIMEQSLCFLFGHRDTPTQLRSLLKAVIGQQIVQHHVPEFVVGQRGNFDRMAAGVLRELKDRYPDITLTNARCLGSGHFSGLFTNPDKSLEKRDTDWYNEKVID